MGRKVANDYVSLIGGPLDGTRVPASRVSKDGLFRERIRPLPYILIKQFKDKKHHRVEDEVWELHRCDSGTVWCNYRLVHGDPPQLVHER